MELLGLEHRSKHLPLDSKSSDEVVALLKKSNKEYSKTIIMITHNMEIAKEADRIIKIEEGRIAISPLHDKDIDPTGESKKPHYHIILNYDGPTTYEHVKELCDSLNMTIPIKLESLRNMYRYHLHLDNPEKYQYDDREYFDKN